MVGVGGWGWGGGWGVRGLAVGGISIPLHEWSARCLAATDNCSVIM